MLIWQGYLGWILDRFDCASEYKSIPVGTANDCAFIWVGELAFIPRHVCLNRVKAMQ